MSNIAQTRLSRMCRGAAALGTLAVAACTTIGPPQAADRHGDEIQILAINDLHGNLEAPETPTTYYTAGNAVQAPLGGAARLAAKLAELRRGQDGTITVAAGDLIGASPLVSAYFLDEPTIMALNRMGLSLSAVGNHEFDNGVAELRRIQSGGCEAHTQRTPCRIDMPFEGAHFEYLAANVIDEQGHTLFPGTAMRRLGNIEVGFIGMTLKETGKLTSPGGTRGYRFADEADTANRLAAQLSQQGADAIVLLLHQGGQVDPFFNQDACPGLEGDILPILQRLTPAIRVVISGHTHKAYICHVPDGHGGERLLTSGGRYGYFVTDIRLRIDPASDRVLSAHAVNDPVTASAGEQPDVAAIVRRYAQASTEIASSVVGRITGSLEADGAPDSPLARLIADAQLAATRDPSQGAARIAFINSGGVRAGFSRAGDGSVTYRQIFTLQPFGNTLEVLQLTGAQLKHALEEQFPQDTASAAKSPILIPSRGFGFSYDTRAPKGQRIVAMSLDGKPIDPEATYRVTVNSFLAQGGDGFSTFPQAKFVTDAGNDLEALQAFIADGAVLSTVSRVTDVAASENGK